MRLVLQYSRNAETERIKKVFVYVSVALWAQK